MFDICTFMSCDNNTDTSFIVKIRNLNVLDVHLQFCNEQIKIYSNYRYMSYPLKSIVNYDNLDNHINEISKMIKTVIGDIVLEYSFHSEPYFIEKLYRIDNIDDNFIKLLVKDKKRNYCYNDIVKILGYDIHNSEHNKYLISIINNLEQNTDHKMTKKIDSTFLITHIDFYKICSKSGKTKAKIFLEYYDQMYELAIDYLKYSKSSNIIKEKDEIIEDLNKHINKLIILNQKLKQSYKIIRNLFLNEINIMTFINNLI